MLGEEVIPEIEEPTEPHTIKEVFNDDIREIKEGKFWIPFKIIEFPFVIARQATIPFLDEDVYCKEINLITFICVPWFTGLMAGRILYIIIIFIVGWNWYMLIVYALLSIAGGCFIWFCTERNKRPKKTWVFLV